MRPTIEELRRAFEGGEFQLHYQPILRLRDGHMVAAEALLRWNHPSEGLVAPGLFLPALEEGGLIVELGCWAVREAVRQVGAWRLLYGRDIVEWVGVNLSPSQLDRPEPLLETLRSLSRLAFPAHRLKLEIGEGAMRRRRETTRTLFPELHQLGVHVVVEEFTGDASLAELGDIAIDAVKIDAGLTARIGTPSADLLVEALRDLAHTSRAAIIAQGIETLQQGLELRACGCGLGQGYLFADPMDGALLGAYALSRAVNRPRAAPITPPTSIGRSRAG